MWTTNISIIFLFAQTVTSISRVKTNGYFSSSVTFDPGVGYENFLVKIDDDFEESNCAQILNDLKNTIQESSNALCAATDGVAHFSSVTIILPDRWASDLNCYSPPSMKTYWPRVKRADAILKQNHLLFGTRPYSFQYGECGVGALPIRIPLGLLTSSNRGKDVVHQWFHYRYGVYDENGIRGDPLFPSGYRISPMLDSDPQLPTSCTNTPLNGQWIDNTWIIDGGNSNENVSSSLMFSTDLVSIDHVCSTDNHRKSAPTKQNWHCNGRSIADVIRKHSDFTTRKNDAQFYDYKNYVQCPQTNFTFASNPVRGYHIIIDVSSSMNSLFLNAKTALSQFVWLLPDGVQVSIDTFSLNVTQIQQPVGLNSTMKNSILKLINNLQTDSSSSIQGLGPALDRALQMFRSGMEIILITAASETPTDFALKVSQPQI